MTDQKYYSTGQVADLLGINRNTFIRALWDGRVKPPRRGPGRAFLWTEPDIIRAAEILKKPIPTFDDAPENATTAS